MEADVTGSTDTGQILADQAAIRDEAESEAGLEWLSSRSCGECCWCSGGAAGYGRCGLLDISLTPDMMADTIAEAGCFD